LKKMESRAMQVPRWRMLTDALFGTIGPHNSRACRRLGLKSRRRRFGDPSRKKTSELTQRRLRARLYSAPPRSHSYVMAKSTPADVLVPPRDIRFELEAARGAHWLSGDP